MKQEMPRGQITVNISNFNHVEECGLSYGGGGGLYFPVKHEHSYSLHQ